MATQKVVNKDNFEELLLESAGEALDFTRGFKDLKVKLALSVNEPPKYSKTKIKRIRGKLGVSQPLFAKIFGVSTSAIQHWEQGMRNMPSSARRLLSIIEKNPKVVLELMFD